MGVVWLTSGCGLQVVDIWESQEYLARTKLNLVRCILEYPAASLVSVRV